MHVAYVVSAAELGFHPADPTKLESSQFNNELKVLAVAGKYRDIYGLRCYEGKILKNRVFCHSALGGVDNQGVLFTVDVPFYGSGATRSLMRANYFSKRYGGVEVSWWTSAKNLPRWRDLDTQIWRFLATWNVAHAKKSAR